MNFTKGEVLKVTYRDKEIVFYITKSMLNGTYSLYKAEGNETSPKQIKKGATTPIEFDTIIYKI